MPDKTDSNTVAISLALLALVALLLGITSVVKVTAEQPSTTQPSTQPLIGGERGDNGFARHRLA